MRALRRTGWGFRLLHLGIGLRTAATCLAGALLVALVAAAVLLPVTGRPFPAPLGALTGDAAGVGLGTWCWQGAAVILLAFTGVRLLALALGAGGWLLLGAAERTALDGVLGLSLPPAAGEPPPPERGRIADPRCAPPPRSAVPQ